MCRSLSLTALTLFSLLLTGAVHSVAVTASENTASENGASKNTDPQNTTSEKTAAENSADASPVVHFTLHPAALPYAALKYRLLPRAIEQASGNAAPQYFRAALVWTKDQAFQDFNAVPWADSKFEVWLKLPLDELAKNEEAQKFFNERPTGQWDLISMAARREQCDWDLPIRELNISTPIPELFKLRDFGRLLAFKARIEISRGQFDQALETLKTGLAMARHAAKAPTLVSALAGVQIANLMLNQLNIMIQQPKCPNLYWALTLLPDPLIDMSDALGFEGSFLYLFLPELRDVQTAVHTDAEWDKILLHVTDKLIEVMPGVGDQKKDLSWYGMGAMFAVTAYPKAKQQLEAAGYSPSQIKDMCVSQAILVAEVETFEHLNNNTFKWFFVDAPSALKGLAQADKDLQALNKANQEIIPLASLLLPALKKVKSEQIATARHVTALRVAEALRLYAADHHDQLPPQLADIQSVPIPNDPATNQPFDYSLSGSTATLTAPAPLGQSASDALHWELQLAPGKK